jgi:predicted phage-related endonuclease
MYELEVVVDNAADLAANDQDAFAMLRRQGFGASDSSVLLGVNPFPDGTIEKLMEQKRAAYVTDAEKAIGQMINVRIGNDLEPLILKKFQQRFNIAEEDVQKPTAMYRIKDTALTVNYDGILELAGFDIPVECKYVSMYGGKYYQLGKATSTNTLPLGGDIAPLGDEVNVIYLNKRAEEAGIPIYYYTQIQQQMMGKNAPWAYLVALFHKTWEIEVFTVNADPKVWDILKHTANALWKRI